MVECSILSLVLCRHILVYACHIYSIHGIRSILDSFPYSSIGKESACSAGGLGLIPGLGRSPGRGHGSPLQYSCLENPNGLQPTRLLCPWDFPGNSTRVDCHFLLQGIFPTQGLNPGLPHPRQTLYRLSPNTKAQGLVKVSSAILDLIGSNQFFYGCVMSNKIHLSN